MNIYFEEDQSSTSKEDKFPELGRSNIDGVPNEGKNEEHFSYFYTRSLRIYN